MDAGRPTTNTVWQKYKEGKVLPNLDVIYTIGFNCIAVNILSYMTKSFLESLIMVTTAQ